ESIEPNRVRQFRIRRTLHQLSLSSVYSLPLCFQILVFTLPCHICAPLAESAIYPPAQTQNAVRLFFEGLTTLRCQPSRMSRPSRCSPFAHPVDSPLFRHIVPTCTRWNQRYIHWLKLKSRLVD